MRRSSVWLGRLHARTESVLEAERAQLPLWVPILLGAGIIAWFTLPAPPQWMAWIAFWLGAAAAFGAVGRGGRLPAALAIGAVLLAAGCLLIWAKALLVAQPPLSRAAVVEMEARVLSATPLAARGLVRLEVAPLSRPDLPARVRINAAPDQMAEEIAAGDRIAVRARLMPPAPAALPGAYDFARAAYFSGLGATGRALGKVQRLDAATAGGDARASLAHHIAARLPGPEGTIAITLATGNQNWISEADADAMRRSGLAHLLSISGLHVSALIGGVILIMVSLLALSPTLALRWPVLMIAACVGGAAGIGYTVFTGAQVPTIRSCIAALLVIAGMALGREAIGLRLIATGALIVMIFWPQAVIGPSFQMSFVAVTAIVALYEYPPARRLFERRDEGRIKRWTRSLGALLATGLLVELVLTPIAFAHFHRSGLLGAAANMIAIPLTSFVVMPAEVFALVLDAVGLGAPVWWVVGVALKFLLWIAHSVASQPFATLSLPVSSGLAFALAMIGLLWLMLWHTALRWWGLPLVALGFLLTFLAPSADVLVTADGHHVAVRLGDGRMALLRDRSGDYVRTTLAEASAYDGEFASLAQAPDTRCTRDMCAMTLPGRTGQPPVHLLISRSRLLVPYPELVAACAQADLVIADRRLPPGCVPRWAKLDRPALSAMGGALVLLDSREIVPGHDPRSRHPWIAGTGSR
ncbi:ComEC/Rec2 family competence protein [Sphingobium sp. B8D3D]|uniref:ComEC/Rec2 family competence protein n=1 Tax=Sphingobium sp. B8D3D TaxID=2940587 RepID=UPI0022258709|nr:ComEC/Rec2 family competence protein [Sphingobium sp. B8D3D]